MRTPIIAMALVLTASVANAEPVYLKCQGETMTVNGTQRHMTDERTPLSLSVDMFATTVTVFAYASSWTTLIMNDPSEDVMLFAEPSPPNRQQGSLLGMSVGLFNRITGAAVIDLKFTETSSVVFGGTCKGALKLF